MLTNDELLKDLTDAQREAVTHLDGPLLIIAGAGSGKTRVITRRVAFLLAQGVVPASLLAITFTNKAAGEMKERISAAMPRPLRDFGRLDQPWPIICTFHSLGLRILKHYSARIGLPANFSIYDTSDQERVIKEAMSAAEVSSQNNPPGAIHASISKAKNMLLAPEAYASVGGSFFDRNVARVYKHYQQLLAHNNALDFDDLLMRTAFAFRDHAEVLQELQERFQYILIDEYQDTNHAQYVIAHALALKHRNICVVGDPDQSIYAWRGADIQNILDFEKDYPDAKVVKLEQNYRSTQTILDIASTLIARNRQRKEKALWTTKGHGEHARLFICPDEHAEAQAVAAHFKKLAEDGAQWSQMAIFYRMNSLSRVMEDALRRKGIPYRIARGVDFYHRAEIKDVLAYLRAIANPADELSLARIINVPARGIGATSIKQLQVHALSNQWTLWETLSRIDEISNVATRTITAVRSFMRLMERWRTLASRPAEVSARQDEVPWDIKLAPDDEMPAGPADSSGSPLASAPTPGRVAWLVEDVVRTSGLESHLRKIGGVELTELANVNELISSAAQFDEEHPEGSLDDYLGQISLVSDVDALDDNGGAVTLMTLHAAKGLEFPVVAIIGLEEGCLPHARVQDHPEQLEEERRLCFVGITRAQQKLVLSQAQVRQIRGRHERTIPSRFINEMPRELIDVISNCQSQSWEYDDAHELNDEDDSAPAFRPGQGVRHPQFGRGKIVELVEMGRHTRVIVEFAAAGRKTLILEYAKLVAG